MVCLKYLVLDCLWIYLQLVPSPFKLQSFEIICNFKAFHTILIENMSEWVAKNNQNLPFLTTTSLNFSRMSEFGIERISSLVYDVSSERQSIFQRKKLQTMVLIIFWDFLIFYRILFLPRVKPDLIIKTVIKTAYASWLTSCQTT